jgi:hypothetical protein
MEEPQKITQEIPDEASDKTTPHAETNFGDETFDGTPIKRGHFSGLNETIFALMRPKKKVTAVPRQITPKGPVRPTAELKPETRPPTLVSPTWQLPGVQDGYEIRNGLPLKRKTLAERVRDQIRFPVLKSAPATIYGIALIVFATGAYLLYSALPTRPDLVIGILMVSIAGNLIINR